MEDLDTYRTICANRIRRLERFQKARSFCSLEDQQSTSTPNTTFELIREKMFSLMENDMSLLQQLLTLGDQISEIKKERLRKTQSQTSIDEYEGEDDEEEEEDGFGTFSASMSAAVTNLYVNDEKPQFFSRQNSVLRIPIPPRSSNRFGPRRIIRRPSDVLTSRQNVKTLSVNSSDEGTSCDERDSSIVQKDKKNRSSNSSIDSGIRDESSPTFESEVI
ncbi:unnamed protein product [Caenorhabditis angaria]|uniref:Uncharacterized protein n=1 Tax=Caenorhabditis angaria TaxID=860376 RepID=A0A9P1IEU8_9PELO|nr:unnamed protein product [Caenorhabditis angaria]